MTYLNLLKGLDFKEYSFTGQSIKEGASGFPKVRTKVSSEMIGLVVESGTRKVKHDDKVYVLLGETVMRTPTDEYVLQGVYVLESQYQEAKNRLKDVWFTKYAKVINGRVVPKVCGDVNAVIQYNVDGDGYVSTNDSRYVMRDWTLMNKL